MVGRIVEIQSPGHYLSVVRGHLCIEKDKELVARLPIRDISVLLFSTPACAVSLAVLNRLLGAGAQVVFCGENYLPSGVISSFGGPATAGPRLKLQTEISAPLKKKIWKEIVKAKIINQIAVVEAVGADSGSLRALVHKVRSGDTTNCEGQAARLYWPLVMGAEFRRQRAASDVNVLLNYGYTVLRAATARAVAATGLSPIFSLFHSSTTNPLALVDDLMEPFRPLVDFVVWRLRSWGIDYLCPESKSEIADVLTLDINKETGISTLPQTLLMQCQSYVRCLESRDIKELYFLRLSDTFLSMSFSDEGTTVIE